MHRTTPSIGTDQYQWESSTCFTMYSGSPYRVSQTPYGEAWDGFYGQDLAESEGKDIKTVCMGSNWKLKGQHGLQQPQMLLAGLGNVDVS